MVEAAHSRAESSSAPPSAVRRADDTRLGPPTPRVALVIVAAAMVAVLLWLGRDAIGPFIIGLLLVYLLDRRWIASDGWACPDSSSIPLVYAVFVVGLVLILYLTVPPLLQQIGQFFGHTLKLERARPGPDRPIRQAYELLDIPLDVRGAIDRLLATFGQETSLNPGIVVPVFNSVAGFVASTFGFLIIPVWVFYLLKDRPSLTHAFDEVAPRGVAPGYVGHHPDRRTGLRPVGPGPARPRHHGRRWRRSSASRVLGILVDPVFAQFALFLAILAGLLELLPIIGPIIAAIPLVLLGATASVQAALAALLLAIAIQQLENYFLVPKIQGDAVKLHPSAVMFCPHPRRRDRRPPLGAILALPVGRDRSGHLPLPVPPPHPAERGSVGRPGVHRPGVHRAGAHRTGAHRAGGRGCAGRPRTGRSRIPQRVGPPR